MATYLTRAVSRASGDFAGTELEPFDRPVRLVEVDLHMAAGSKTWQVRKVTKTGIFVVAASDGTVTNQDFVVTGLNIYYLPKASAQIVTTGAPAPMYAELTFEILGDPI